MPPHTIISLPVHTTAGTRCPAGAPVVLVGLQVSVDRVVAAARGIARASEDDHLVAGPDRDVACSRRRCAQGRNRRPGVGGGVVAAAVVVVRADGVACRPRRSFRFRSISPCASSADPAVAAWVSSYRRGSWRWEPGWAGRSVIDGRQLHRQLLARRRPPRIKGNFRPFD